MTTESASGLPESFASAALRANHLYPQCNTGLNFFGGKLLVAAVMRGEMQVRQAVAFNPTEAQIAALFGGAIAGHDNYRMPCTPGAVSNVKDHLYAEDRIKRLATGWIRDGVPTVVASYAAVVLPGEVAPLQEQDATYQGYQEQKYTAAQTLLDWADQSSPRPEAVALSGLFAAGTDVLTAKPALTVAKGYRDELRFMYGPDITPGQWRRSKSKLAAAIHLAGLVRVGVDAALPDIAETAGYAVPSAAVEIFMSKATSGIKANPTNHMRQLLAEV